MSFAGNTLDLIRTVFNREGVMPIGPSYFDSINSNAISYSNVTLGPQNGYNDYLTDSVKLDQDLMSRYADYEDMDDFPELGCIDGQSLVRTLDGPIRIKDLAKKYKPNELFKIIAYDRKLKKFVVADAHSPRFTKHGKVVEIQFDNGSVLRCTPDHKILTRKNQWKEAKDFQVGEAVMPLETRLRNDGYLKICHPEQPDNQRWEHLHRMVGRQKGDLKGMQVHHKNENPLDNNWDNLELLTPEDHCRIHSPAGTESSKNLLWTEERRKKHAERLKGNSYAKGKLWTEERRKAMDRSFRQRKNPKSLDEMLNAVRSSYTLAEAAKKISLDWTTLNRRLARNGINYKDELGKTGTNHRIVRIVECDETIDVYDLTTEKHHNFVANGIVVHNSALDIYADDATVQDVITGRSLWFEAEDLGVETALEDMLTVNLKAEESLWEVTRSLCKYGNEFNELMVLDGVGVVRMNHIPAPSVRRIEDVNGILYGYLHDPTMVFRMDTKTFLDRLQAKGSSELSAVPYDATYQDLMQVYEPWEVCHMRLRGKTRRDLYGYSVLEPARWAWKRLTMLEDAMVLYKLCLRGDSKIWTPKGYKFIKDLSVGDEVYCFDDREVKRTRVCHKKHNGKDQIYKVSSVHRDLYANATHPVLVQEIEKRGKGRPTLYHLKYVEVQNLIPKKHSLVTPPKPATDFKQIKLRIPELKRNARLKHPIKSVINTNDFQKCGVSSPYARMFFDDRKIINERAAISLVTKNGDNPDEVLEFFDDWGGCENVNIPKYVDEDFARWFGWMLGDGYVTTFKDKKGNVHRRVGFSCGDKDFFNEKYKKLFEKIVGKVKFGGDSNNRLGYYQVASKPFAEFMELNGFIPGAHNKRIPSWVFETSYSIKMAFLNGFIDADGHRSPQTVSSIRGRTSYARARIELCNKGLVDDFRLLAMQMGLTVTKILTRKRKGNGRKIKGTNIVLNDRVSYQSDIVFKIQSPTEKITAIEKVGTDDIWDISVENKAHNFISDGVVVHNTRSPQRYAYYVDVGDVPPNQARGLVNKIKNDFKKTKFVDPETGKPSFRYNPLSMDEDIFVPVRKGRRSTEIEVLSGPEGQQTDDVEYFLNKIFAALKIPKSYLGADETVGRANLCLVPETKIPLLDGRILTMRDLIDEFNQGKQNWVHSLNKENKLVPGKISGAKWTRRNADIVRVHLDNGQYIDATPDHRFMLRNGSYLEAEKLLEGQSLMPYYHRYSDNKLKGYSEVYNPYDGKYHYVHRFVKRYFNSLKNGYVVHHVDFNKLNNNPENLRLMKSEDHLQLHRDHCKKTLHRSDVRKRTLEAAKKWVHSEENKKICRENLKKGKSDDDLGDLAIKIKAKSKTDLMNELKCSKHLIDTIIKTAGKTYKEFSIDFMGFYRGVAVGDYKNHKVVKIEKLTLKRDCCDIEVDEFHNFATEAGVFVHNSQLDVRHARSVMRIQREVKNGYDHIAKVDLSAKNIDPDKVSYTAHMVVPSGVFELAQMEVATAKLELADRYKQAEFSEYYIWSEILGMSDEDISKIQKQRATERESNLDQEEVEHVRELIPKAVDVARDRMDKKLDNVTPKIIGEIHEGQTKFAKKMKELKNLTFEIRQAVKNQRYYRGRK